MEENLNLYQKLAKIRKPAEVIKKNKRGYGYTYVTEDEILSKISGLMEKYGVSLIPNILNESTKVEPYNYVKTKMDKQGKVYEEHCNEVLVQADMVWIWVNNDNPEERIVVPWVLIGQQSEASQAFGSALTYSARYFMLKYFNVATSDDDPENFYKKKKEAEQQEQILVAKEIINTVHELVEKRLAQTPEDRDNLKKVIKKYVKTANYFEIKNPDVASRLLEDVKAFCEDKKEGKTKK